MVSSCEPEDEVYEYEDDQYYIRGVKKRGGDLKCVNVINSADSNGILKNLFIKMFENEDAGLISSLSAICSGKASRTVLSIS